MISASSEYKEIMNRPIRNRAFISVGIGIINQNAQASGKASGDFTYWSYGDVFNTNTSRIEYATLEDNFMKADGSQYFMPENDDLMQAQQNGITTENVNQPIRIDFPEVYAIKGITIEFASAYPTSFKIKTAEKTLTYSNDSEKFVTADVLGDTDYIIITPLAMVGGNQRFRIKSVLMGVGLQYGNQQTKDFNIDEYVSPISEDLPSENMVFSFYDEDNNFDVDDANSFMDFLETMQKITVSFGLELDNGEVEWHQILTQYLKEWKSQEGIVSFTATDRLSQMEDEYSLANRIYERTAYKEAESIFSDAGLEPDEYYIDDYLNDIILNNPMPEGTHKECLQILANACRCAIRQDANGKIAIQANFAIVLDPEDLSVETNGIADWSKSKNLLIGTSTTYADMTRDFMRTDGQMYFLPEDRSYLDTSYVSKQISDENGAYNKNLIPYPYSDANKTQNGITWTVNSDGSVTAKGSNTVDGQNIFNLRTRLESGNDKLVLPAGIYTISGCPSGGKGSNWYIQVGKTGSDGNWQAIGYDYGNGVTITLIEKTQLQIQLIVRTANDVDITFKPQLEVGEIATSYQPFQGNPTIAITMPAAHTYYGVNIDFAGNSPKEMIIHTQKNGVAQESVYFSDLKNKSTLHHEFLSFDKMIFEFTKGYPNNRILINKISFGSLSDYVLTKTNMLENPIGYKEKRVKAVRVKMFTYQNNQDGAPTEVEDEIYETKIIGDVGEVKTLQNPLVSTKEHAEMLAEWIGNYYANNISYDVKFRGEPRLNAADIIHMESKKRSNLQVEVTRNKLSFNGTFRGELELRKALKMTGE